MAGNKVQPQKTTRQLVKIPSNLTKIVELNLDSKKKDLMKKSVLHKLVEVEHGRESSSTFIAALCKFYNPEYRSFVFNHDVSMSFCVNEVAQMLGIDTETGSDYKVYVNTKSKFPGFMYRLRQDICCIENDVDFQATHLKQILSKMRVDTEDSKLWFQKLMSYFLAEQVLLCSSGCKRLRLSFWGLVEDLEKFESINWPRATFDHICSSLKEFKMKMEGPGQHQFTGFAPALEALVYARIKSMQPPILEAYSDSPIQRYRPCRPHDVLQPQRTLSQLTLEEISPCTFCTSAEEDTTGAEDATPSLEHTVVLQPLDMLENFQKLSF